MSLKIAALVPLCLAAAATSATANTCRYAADASIPYARPTCDAQYWLLTAQVFSDTNDSATYAGGLASARTACTGAYTDCNGTARNNVYVGNETMTYDTFYDESKMTISWTITEEFVSLVPCAGTERYSERRSSSSYITGWMNVFCN